MSGLSLIDLIGLIGGALALVLTWLQIKKMRDDRLKARELAALAGAPEQRVNVMVSTAETAVVFLRNTLERAEDEIRRKDAIIERQERRIASLETRVEELERDRRG